MPRKRQIVLTRSKRADNARPGELASMGTKAEFTSALARFNTGPDGSARSTGMDILWGPGMIVEIPSGNDQVVQAMVTMTDEEIAMPVLMRACKSLGWAMTDLETGRSFG